MCYQIAKGSTYCEVFGMDSANITSWNSKISDWYKSYCLNKSTLQSWGADEFMLRDSLVKWSKKTLAWKVVYVSGLWGGKWERNLSRYNNMKVDLKELKSGKYLELEPRRPSDGGMDDLNYLKIVHPTFQIPPITFKGVQVTNTRHAWELRNQIKKVKPLLLRSKKVSLLKVTSNKLKALIKIRKRKRDNPFIKKKK